jgi:hypothetical protein
MLLPNGIAMRANGNSLRRGKCGLDRHRLPTGADYYPPIFGDLRFNASGWARCVFHEDSHASLSIHYERGAFWCFVARAVATGSHLRCCIPARSSKAPRAPWVPGDERAEFHFDEKPAAKSSFAAGSVCPQKCGESHA